MFAGSRRLKKYMATVIESKQEQLDTETISEYIREPKVEKTQPRSYSLDILSSASDVISVAKALKGAVVPAAINLDGHISSLLEKTHVKPDVLETLWPGVHQDFSHNVHIKRTPSFYLMLGFMGGAVIALIMAWSFSSISALVANYGKSTAGLSQSKANDSQATATTTSGVRTPLVSTYTVQDGDTLAGIALQNYKHVSPRLLDEICKANNLTDANLLVSGQKLTLPEYHY